MSTPTSFADLGVPEHVIAALADRGITEPFEIQRATIADALAGRDICGRAPTGSGKTLAFGVPLVAEVGKGGRGRPRGLILAPTRELADQITDELRSFAGKVRVGVVYGGVGYGKQRDMLRRGVDVLVACPGRLEDLIQQGDVDLGDVDKVVIDEADRMCDMGFLPIVKRLLDQTRSKRQTVLFSATLDGAVRKLTEGYQRNPVRHEVGESTPDVTAADHYFWQVERPERVEATAQAIGAVWPAIVFCRTRHGADRLVKQLRRHDIEGAAIHGGRSQNQRTRALAAFADGKVHALVATDVAARGIHVDGVALVVHFDPPDEAATYVHRSGRTARAGETGTVVSMVGGAQRREVAKMVRSLGIDEPVTEPDIEALRGDATGPSRPRPTGLPVPAAPKKGSSSRGSSGKRSASGGSRGRRSGGRGGRGDSDGSRDEPSTKGRGKGNGGRDSGGGSRSNGGRRGGTGGPTEGTRSGGRARRSSDGSTGSTSRGRGRSGPRTGSGRGRGNAPSSNRGGGTSVPQRSGRR